MPNNTYKLERQYWNKIRGGDDKAFMDMYDAYYPSLFIFGCRINPNKEIIKDAIHELFCEVWENRTTLPEVLREKSYLFTYLKRKILKELQSAQKSSDLEKTLPIENALSYEELLIRSQTNAENQIKLQQLLDRISPAQLEIIRYKFFEQLSYEEIAIRMGLQPRTVYNQVYEALKTMRSHLKILLMLVLLFTDYDMLVIQSNPICVFLAEWNTVVYERIQYWGCVAY